MTTLNKHTQFCKDQFACDGNTLTGTRVEKGTCVTCEKARAKRAKPAAGPRGMNSALIPTIKSLRS